MTEDIFKEKKAFNFYRSYYETSLLLNGDDKLEFMEAILHYQFTGELLEPKSPFALLAFKGQIHSLNKQVIGYVKGKSGTINNQPPLGSPPLTPPRVTPPHPRVQVQEKEQEEVKDKYKYTLFSQIKDLPDVLNSFEGDKRYFFIAYKFWALWKHENPNHKTLINAKIDNWYNEVRKMVEIDKTSIDRILAVYAYFSKYEQKGFRRFWFDTIQSVAALRGKNKNGEYTLDKIAIEINAKTAEDTEFYQYIQSIIKKFNNNESLKSPQKEV